MEQQQKPMITFTEANVAADRLMMYVSAFPPSKQRQAVNLLLVLLFRALSELEETSEHERE